MVKYELRKSTGGQWKDGIDIVRCDGDKVLKVCEASYDGRIYEMHPELVLVELNRLAVVVDFLRTALLRTEFGQAFLDVPSNKAVLE